MEKNKIPKEAQNYKIETFSGSVSLSLSMDNGGINKLPPMPIAPA
jgi:hypothetical protein